MGIYTFIWISYCFWLLAFPKVSCRTSYAPVVELPLGKAVGIQVETPDTIYNAYRGIPYAEVPLGSRRFEPPEVYSEPWLGERLFTVYRNDCIGLDHLGKTTGSQVGPDNKKYKISGSEDCLYLNVHAGVNITRPTPVIFFIHGGFFSYSDPRRYGPDYLMNKNIVHVNFAYRVGPFGFLTTGSDACSGNMGLKDIIQALNWVKVNIWRFGGDTNRITMAGIDAGAASAHLLYFARISDSLFNNAISFSGTAFSPWAFSKISTIVSRARALGMKLNCRTTKIRAGDFLRCLRSRSAEEIVEALASSKKFYYLPFAQFTPVDDSIFLRGLFLNNPLTLAKENRGKLNDWMTGYTAYNGLYPIAEFVSSNALPSVVNERWNDILPDLLFFDRNCSIISILLAPNDRPYYSRNLAKIVTYRNFMNPAVFAAKQRLRRNSGKTYLFIYDNFTVRSRAAALTNVYWKEHYFYGKASHGDDVASVFSIPFYGPGLHLRDRRVRKLMIDLVVSFSSTGRPPTSLNWKEVEGESTLGFFNVSGAVTALTFPSWYRSSDQTELESYYEDPICQL